MKKSLLALIVVVLALTSCKPDARDTQGNPINIADYKGKWLVINYWAPWCKPCLKELPELNALYLIYKSRLMVLGVSFDKMSDKDIDKFAKKLGITFPVLQTFPMEKFGVENISILPITFLISPQGTLAKILTGPQTMADIENAIGFTSKRGYRIEERGLQKNFNKEGTEFTLGNVLSKFYQSLKLFFGRTVSYYFRCFFYPFC